LTCHPTHHLPAPPGTDTEEQTRAWDEFHRASRIDPRAINKHHKWAPGQHPEDDAEHGWQTFRLEFMGDQTPKQRELLHGGPESGLHCACAHHPNCGEMMRVGAAKSLKEVFTQPEVGISGTISEDTWKAWESENLIILICPKCLCITQLLEKWYREMRKHATR